MKIKTARFCLVLGTLCGCAMEVAEDNDVDTTNETQQAINNIFVTGYQFSQFGSTQYYGSAPELWFSKFSVSASSDSPVGYTNWSRVVGASPGLRNPDLPLSGVGGASWNANISSAVEGARLDIFYVNENGTVAQAASVNGGATWSFGDWGRPTAYIGPFPKLYGKVGVSSWGDQRIDIFVLGTTGTISDGLPNNRLYHKSYDHGTWYGWHSIGSAVPRPGAVVGAGVAAVSWGPNRIDVFGRGEGALQHWFSTDGINFGTDSWAVPGGVYWAPSVASWGPGRLDVFYNGDWQNGYSTRQSWWDNGAHADYAWGQGCTPDVGNPTLGTGAISGLRNYVMDSTLCSGLANSVRHWSNSNGLGDTYLAPAFSSGGGWPYAVSGSHAVVLHK